MTYHYQVTVPKNTNDVRIHFEQNGFGRHSYEVAIDGTRCLMPVRDFETRDDAHNHAAEILRKLGFHLRSAKKKGF